VKSDQIIISGVLSAGFSVQSRFATASTR
jgi:hypothetical protein